MQTICKLVFIMLVLKARKGESAALKAQARATRPWWRLFAAPAAPLPAKAAAPLYVTARNR